MRTQNLHTCARGAPGSPAHGRRALVSEPRSGRGSRPAPGPRPGGGIRLAPWLGTVLLIVAASLLSACRSTPWDLASAGLGLAEPQFTPVVDRDIMIPMRDGIRLAADRYRPRQDGRYPAIVIRTPYGKRNPVYGYDFFGRLFAAHGYTVIIQDVRGKHRSEGEFFPIAQEEADGIDTVRWTGVQPWCDGSVGMFGLSYYGSTEWLATPGAPESLKTVVPVFTSQDTYKIWLKNGVFNFDLTLTWHERYDVREQRVLSLLDLHRAFESLPLIAADDRLGYPNPIYDRWIANPQPGEFWRRMSVNDRPGQIRCSALMFAGWFDPFVDAMFEDYLRMRSRGGSEAARDSQLIVGPWTHTTESRFRSTDYGTDARFLGQVKSVMRWYDHWLKGEANGVEEEGPIRIFVMGTNQWRTEQEWPLARTRFQAFFLHGVGTAPPDSGRGLLSGEPPTEEQSDIFLYDPADPVPSRGQAGLFGDISYQPTDQREIESRSDVLTYTTPRLAEAVEVTGPVELVLYAASSAPDTDFTAKLTDVYPDGRSIQVTSGIVRARFRDSLTEPSLIEPGSVHQYRIRLGPTSNVFQAGHRIRVQISSSDFPRLDRNLNTGGTIGQSAEIAVAVQSVYHDGQRPSHLVLPVIPSGEGSPLPQ
jgi:putative CocE/NonD family hydrolase